MPLSKIRKMAMKQIGRIMASEKTMQLLSNPKVQTLMMRAFTLQDAVRRRLDKGVASAAKRLNLATREDVTALKRAVRNLESQVARQSGPAKS